MATLPVSDTRKNTVTLGSSSAGPINVGFRLFSTDIRVFVDDEETTAFTLTATFEDGFEDDATITFDSAQDAGAKIDIISDYQPERSEDYLASDPQLAQKLNIELGQLWGRVADANRDIARAPLIPVDASTLDLHLPNPTSGATLVGRSDGKGWETGPTSDEISNAQGYATAASDSADEAADSASLFPTLAADRFIQAAADGLSWVARTAAQVRTALGLSSADTPTFEGLDLSASLPTITLTDSDETDVYGQIAHSAGETWITSRDGASNGPIVFRGAGGGTTTEYARFNGSGDFRLGIGNILFGDASTGFIGFGTATPAATLDAEASGTKHDFLRMNADMGTNTAALTVEGPDADSTTAPYVVTSDNGLGITVGSYTHLFDTNGNLGIGGTPSDKLHVFGTSGPQITIEDTGDNRQLELSVGHTGFDADRLIAPSGSFRFYNNSDEILRLSSTQSQFYTNNTERMRINSVGNVGIGTTSPQAELDVDGGITTTGGTTNDRGVFLSHQNNINASFVSRSENGSADLGNRILWDFDDDSFQALAGGVVGIRVDSSGNVTAGGAIKTATTTVASLPSASTLGAGARHFVTDANSTTFASVVAGGGSNGVPVYSDGTNWRIG